MPKWKKDAKEFTVGVNFHEVRGYQTSIPKPVIEHLGKGEKVETVTYIIKRNKVELRAGVKSDD